MVENVKVLTSVKDPANQIGEVFFAGVKSMTVFGVFIGAMLGILLNIFLDGITIPILIAIGTAAIFSIHTILADRRKTKYFELLLQHLEDVFNKNGIHIEQTAIKSLLSLNKYKVDNITELTGYHDKGSYVVSMTTYEASAPKTIPKKFVVETD